MEMTEGLTGFDWVVLALVGLLGLVGLLRGFTQEAISLAGWIGAAIVVRLFHQDVTLWLSPRVGGDASGAIIAFLLLFFGTVIAAKLLAGAVGGAAKRSVLGPMDRLLGLGFGSLKGVILASVLFLLVQFGTGLFDTDRTPPDWLMKSKAAPLLALSSGAMVGWVKDLQDEAAANSGLDLPPGHPPIDGPFGSEPFGNSPFGGAPPEGGEPPEGYRPQDREALDKLLEEGAKSGEQVEI